MWPQKTKQTNQMIEKISILEKGEQLDIESEKYANKLEIKKVQKQVDS